MRPENPQPKERDTALYEAILRLKWKTPDGEKIPGIAYYRAVLEGGVRSYPEFTTWLREHPAEGIVEWMP